MLSIKEFERLNLEKFKKFKTSIFDELYFIVGGKDKETIPGPAFPGEGSGSTDAFTTNTDKASPQSWDGLKATDLGIRNDGFDF